jgi:hypothetical protein
MTARRSQGIEPPRFEHGQRGSCPRQAQDEAGPGQRWVFQDVHPDGVAAGAAIGSGDILLAVNDQELIPRAATPFRLTTGTSFYAWRLTGGMSGRRFLLDATPLCAIFLIAATGKIVVV